MMMEKIIVVAPTTAVPISTRFAGGVKGFPPPPISFAEVTTSFTWRDSTEVKALTSSGISAPASVPQEMIEASFHHCVVSPPRLGMILYETKYVATIETIEVIQTNEVSGVSKFI